MSRNILLLIATVAWAVTGVSAFGSAFIGRGNVQLYSRSQCASPRRTATLSMRVVDIDSEEAFDKTVKSAGSTLVVVDYSTTWCGPCKVIAPKFEEFSTTYPDAVFLKVIGDVSPDASKLMKREGVRSVPSFHYFVNGERVEVVNGANADAIEGAIKKHLP